MGDSRPDMQFDGPVTVNGDVVLGDQIKNYSGGDGVGPIVPVGAPAPEPTGWRGGADVEIGSRVYLLHDAYLGEHSSPDHSVLVREARALQRVPEPGGDRRRSAYAWLRQVEVRDDTPVARRAVGALRRERDLLNGGLARIRALPHHPFFKKGPDERAASLVVSWPARTTGGPCPGLDAVLGLDGGVLDPSRLAGLCGGLAGLCGTLAKLHEHGTSHRGLTPPALLVLDNGGLVLRDLGLAAHEPEVGEGPTRYQAPEQRLRNRAEPGPPTDVYQVAAIVYDLLTGHPPASRAPLPVGPQVPELPERIGRALDAALEPDPAARPDAYSLGAVFRDARQDLSRALFQTPPPRQ